MFDSFPLLAMTIFRYSHGFYLFRYSLGLFFDTPTDTYFFRYSPGFYHFSVLTQIRPFSGTHWDRFWIQARILSFPVLALNVFRYSHGLYRFPILAQILPFTILAGTAFRYSHGFYLFPVLDRISPFFGTDTNSTLFWYSPELFFYPRTDSTFSRY